MMASSREQPKTPMEYDEDRERREDEPILVRRAVNDAGQKLWDEVQPGAGPAFEKANKKADECGAAGDKDGQAFWSSVAAHLMDREFATAGTETIILEEGDVWDSENEEVIRAGKNPPRSDRDF
jgi:hypothetical protein